MSALPVSGIIFILTSGGILLGALLRRTLPKDHLNEHARDVVRLGVGLIAAIAALVLGLLIGAANICAGPSARLLTASGVRSKWPRPVPLKPVPRRNRFIRKFRSWHQIIMS